jgi:hypothetical protein
MAATQLSDIIVPEVFADYVTQLTVEKSALVQSGVMTRDPQIQALANGGGAHINMPYFNDLSGDAEVMSDTGSFTVNPITAENDIAVKVIRGKAWAGQDLVTVMAGADPLAAVANRVAAFWIRQEQKALIATLNGVFGTALASTHVLDVTGASTALTSDVILDGKQLLGDAGDNIAAIAMHSAKYTALQKANLIATVRDSEGNIQFNTYLGYRIIVDDGLPVATGDYTSYLFGMGAVAGADVTVPNAIEFDRNSLASQDIMITRKGFITHVRGVKWAVSDANPSNAGLATANKWTKVYDDKAIRVVALITK